MALAHAIGDKAEAAYRRGDLFEKRRRLMARMGEALRQSDEQRQGSFAGPYRLKQATADLNHCALPDGAKWRWHKTWDGRRSPKSIIGWCSLARQYHPLALQTRRLKPIFLRYANRPEFEWPPNFNVKRAVRADHRQELDAHIAAE